MIKIATPISCLFKETTLANEIIANTDCLECRDDTVNSTWPNQELFHSDTQLIHDLEESNLVFLKEIKNTKKKLKLISFHVASSCDRPVYVDRIFQPGGKQYTVDDMLKNAKHNIAIIEEIFGDSVDIAIENNNYYQSDAYRYITDPEFISQIVYENDIHFLFDMAHARITAINKAISYEKYIDELPLDKMIQIHICKHGIKEIAYDAHEYPDEELLREVAELISKYNPQYISPEYYKDSKKIIKLLKTIKDLI